MYHVRVDRQKNRLYISIKDRIDDVEVDLVSEEIFLALDELQQGFTVITDLSDAIPVSPQVSERLQRILLALSQKGLKKAVRVVQNIVGAMQLKRLYEESELTYHVIQATSMEEAERILNEDDA
ncbi:hypothetical protein CSA56_07325 [candidate division KSB3 bacterium]|uniref:STAS domain-containing protein n=1 Tax=candidate division KSB3 bacterium TaxID=2044937 RepID=A0A2G6KFZ6_9BACT|nr:MAG: hypothetical protein CSA56_07325 [candidate division KSB3 bacterium]